MIDDYDRRLRDGNRGGLGEREKKFVNVNASRFSL